jgi:predicted enzyme related to lactoylglutathione lyase
MLEILMNFGSTVEAAKANKGAQVVIMQRASDEPKDSLPHIILTVTDMDATLAAVKAAGGATDGPAKEFQHTGILIGFATDPAGNRLELIQQPKAAKKAKKP